MQDGSVSTVSLLHPAGSPWDFGSSATVNFCGHGLAADGQRGGVLAGRHQRPGARPFEKSLPPSQRTGPSARRSQAKRWRPCFRRESTAPPLELPVPLSLFRGWWLLLLGLRRGGSSVRRLRFLLLGAALLRAATACCGRRQITLLRRGFAGLQRVRAFQRADDVCPGHR